MPYDIRSATVRSRGNAATAGVESRLLPRAPETRSGLPRDLDIKVNRGMDQQLPSVLCRGGWR